MVGKGIFRIEPYRLVVISDSEVEIALGVPGSASAIVGGSVFRVEPYCLVEIDEVEVARCQQRRQLSDLRRQRAQLVSIEMEACSAVSCPISGGSALSWFPRRSRLAAPSAARSPAAARSTGFH